EPACAAAGTTAHRVGEVLRPTHPVLRRQHDSGRELLAALATTGAEDGAPGARAHAQPEPVHLGTLPVVRLVSPLAHGSTPKRRLSTLRLGSRCAAAPLLRTTEAVRRHHGRAVRTAWPRYASGRTPVNPTSERPSMPSLTPLLHICGYLCGSRGEVRHSWLCPLLER